MQQNERAAEIVNDLVKINNDRIEGYERAIRDTKDEDSDLKSLFSQMKQESVKLKEELSGLTTQLGEEPTDSTRTDGKIYRAWMAVKATFSGNSRKSVLENCEFGEDAAQKAYRAALSESELTPTIRQVISHQQQELKQSHDKIKQLRNSEE